LFAVRPTNPKKYHCCRPASHRRFYPLFELQFDQLRVPNYGHLPSVGGIRLPPAYLAEQALVDADTDPVEACGGAGDVIFWHHRLGHLASQNFSTCIRQAVLHDFSTRDLDALRATPPDRDNMWSQWSRGVQRCPDHAWSARLAAEQQLVGKRVGGHLVTEANCAAPLALPQAGAENAAAFGGFTRRHSTSPSQALKQRL